MSIEWEHVEKDANGNDFDHLIAAPTDFVTVHLRTDDDGDWVCGLSMILNGDAWTLPQVESWMKRAAALLEDLPRDV